MDATRCRHHPLLTRLVPLALALALLVGLIGVGASSAGAAGASGSGSSQLQSARVDPAPIVTINTQATQGSSTGVQLVGPDGTSKFYAADGNSWLQVLVLKRDSLNLVSNTPYQCPTASSLKGQLDCAKYVDGALRKLDSTVLVIAVSPQLPSGTSSLGEPIGPSSAQAALASIGVASWTFWPSDATAQIRQGLFTAIGVPGSPKGTATESVAPGPTDPSGSAAINGFLVRDNRGFYRFTSPTSFDFNTQAAGSGPSQNVMSVGGRQYPVTIPGGSAGGFQVTTVDQRFTNNLSGPAVTTQWFGTGSASPATSFGQVLAMDRLLTNIIQGGTGKVKYVQYVLIASRGNPGVAIPGDQTFALQIYGAIQTLVTHLTALGATRNGAYGVLQGNTKGKSFTLVGERGLSTGKGYQLLGTITGPTLGLSSAPAAGTFTRNGPYFGLTVGTEGPAASAQNTGKLLNQTVFQASTPWPEHGNAGRTAAIKWFGQKVYDTDDPRTQYWTIPYSVEVWNGKRSDIQSQTYPGGAAFSQSDFDWAKQELSQEITWLEASHAYLASIAQPFAKGSLESWASLQSIAGDVNNKVRTAPSDKVAENISAIIAFAMDAGRELGEPAGTVIGVVDAAYQLVSNLASINSEGTEDAASEFQSTVGNLGKELASRLQDSQDMLTGQFADIISSDYQKLKTVGECAAGHKDGCPQDPGEWQFTQDDQRAAANALQYGAQSTFYAALVGAKYKVYDLPAAGNQGYTTPDRFVGHNAILAEVCIFTGDPAYSSTIADVWHNSQYYITDRYVSVLGYTDGEGYISSPYQMHWPDGSIMSRMFSPVDPAGDITKGGLGMDREATFALFPTHTKLDYFPFRGAPAGTKWAEGWTPCEKGSSAGASRGSSDTTSTTTGNGTTTTTSPRSTTTTSGSTTTTTTTTTTTPGSTTTTTSGDEPTTSVTAAP